MKKYFILFFLSLLSALFIRGEKLFLEEAGLSFWLPDNWTKNVEADYLFAESPQKKALFICTMLDAQTLDEAFNEYPEVLSEYFTQLKIETKLQNLRLIEKETVQINASGFYKKSEMQIVVYLLETEGAITIIICAADKSQMMSFRSIFEQVLRSLEEKFEQKN